MVNRGAVTLNGPAERTRPSCRRWRYAARWAGISMWAVVLAVAPVRADERTVPLQPIPETALASASEECPEPAPPLLPAPGPANALPAAWNSDVRDWVPNCIEMQEDGAWALVGCHGSLYVNLKDGNGIVLAELPIGMHAAVLLRSKEMETLYGGWYIFTEQEEKNLIGVTKVWAITRKASPGCIHSIWYGEGQPKSVRWYPVQNARATSLRADDSLVRKLQTKEIPDEPDTEVAPSPEEVPGTTAPDENAGSGQPAPAEPSASATDDSPGPAGRGSRSTIPSATPDTDSAPDSDTVPDSPSPPAPLDTRGPSADLDEEPIRQIGS